MLSPVLLDAAMGTALDRRGVSSHQPWFAASAVVHAMDTVVAIHREHIEAGAQIITTNTLLAHAGSALDTVRLGVLGVVAARHAAAIDDRVRIAGSIGPLPVNRPGRESAYRGLASTLLEAGVDLLLVETMTEPKEAALATSAALEAAEAARPVWLSIACDDDGELLDGTLVQLVKHVPMERLGAVLVNCTSLEGLVPAIQMLIPHVPAHVWCGAYPNAGATIAGRYEPNAHAMLAIVDALVALTRDRSLDVVGGCCGTDADLIAALSTALQPDEASRDEAWARLEAAVPRP